MSVSAIGNPQSYVVRELDASNEDRWDAFVETDHGGTFFHLSGWKTIIEESLGHPTAFLYCESDGNIVAILPLAHVRSWLFGNALISLPFLVYGGVVASDDRAASCLVEAACERVLEEGIDHLELRNKSPSGKGWPTNDSYATFSKKIDPDVARNLLAIPRKQRAMIRKGIKEGLVAEVDPNATRLYSAMLECKRNLGTPFFAQRYLQDICDVFGDKVEILTVTKGAQLVCSVMSFKFRNEILPYYGGGGMAARHLNGNDFMYWAVMERACQEEIEIFDYGRSMIGSGAYRFKKHWGFEPTSLYYEYFLNRNGAVPSLNPANPKYRFMINAWRHLPLPIAGQLGPPIARRIG